MDGRGGGTELFLELTHEGLDRGTLRGRQGEGKCGLIFFQRELGIIELLVCDNGGIEQRDGVVRLEFEGGVERPVRLGITAALMLDKAKTVPGLGQASVQLEGLSKAVIGRVELSGPELGFPQSDPRHFEVRKSVERY